MYLVIRLLARLPLRLLHMMGALLGWLVYLGSRSYRNHFKQNAARAALSPAQARQAVAAAGQMAAELPWIWLRSDQERKLAIEWEGLDRIDSALARGKGLIYLTPHLGCFEVLPLAHSFWLADRYGPVTVLFRPSRSKALDELTARVRLSPGVQTAPTSTAGVRAMLRALQRGQSVGLLPDQVPEPGLGVWAPFFGQPAYTMTLAMRLARRSGAPVVLIHGERLSHGRGFLIQTRPVELNLDETDEALAEFMNRKLEKVIRAQAGQYLWGYARYKAPVRKRIDAT